MSWAWNRRIVRAEELATRFPESAGLLSFYSQIARYQKSIVDKLTAWQETDVCTLMAYFPELLRLVKRHGPEALAASAPKDPERLLLDFWRGEYTGPETSKFYGRALLQPFAESLAGRGGTCPFGNSRPVVGVLRGEGEGAKRSLLCSLCSAEWQYRRVICPNCGEEDKDKLPVYLAEDLDYIRIDACDTCRMYIKSVDLTRNGHAVPVVDDLASLTLTLWAEENGYRKIETNLLGM